MATRVKRPPSVKISLSVEDKRRLLIPTRYSQITLAHTLILWSTIAVLWFITTLYFLCHISTVPYHNNGTRELILQAACLPVIYGALMILLSLLGHVGQHFHLNPADNTLLESEHGLITFITVLIILTIAELCGLSLLLYLIVYAMIKPNNYHSIERVYSIIFNSFFFVSASGSSHAVQPSSFWNWISNHCPASISKNECFKLEPYAVTSCAAHEYTCITQEGYGFACPYNICRESIMKFANEGLLFILLGTLVFVVMHIIAMIFGMRILRQAMDICDSIPSYSADTTEMRPSAEKPIPVKKTRFIKSPFRPAEKAEAEDGFSPKILSHNTFLFGADDFHDPEEEEEKIETGRTYRSLFRKKYNDKITSNEGNV